jgi:hypothetical protein
MAREEQGIGMQCQHALPNGIQVRLIQICGIGTADRTGKERVTDKT